MDLPSLVYFWWLCQKSDGHYICGLISAFFCFHWLILWILMSVPCCFIFFIFLKSTIVMSPAFVFLHFYFVCFCCHVVVLLVCLYAQNYIGYFRSLQFHVNFSIFFCFWTEIFDVYSQVSWWGTNNYFWKQTTKLAHIHVNI
jgi:hypothetical protein